MMHCVVLPDAATVHAEAARRIEQRITSVQTEGRDCRVALAGGNTPRAVYEQLARAASIDASRLRIFWSDERAVPPRHADSNQRMARQAWLNHVPIPEAHIHPMRGDAPDLQRAARDYEALLHTHLGSPPRFDLVLLGLGSDAHTASLFPGCEALREKVHTVAVTRAPDGAPRLTLTPPALVAAAMVLFIVTGADKAHALRRVLREKHDPLHVPPHALWPAQPLFLVDRPAAGEAED